MPHESLHVLGIRAGLDQPRRPGGPQTLPIHVPESELTCGRLNEPRKYVVVARWAAFLDRLKHRAPRAVCLHHLVFSGCSTCFHFHSDVLQPVNTLDHLHIDADGRVGCARLGSAPISAAAAFVNGEAA